jgi:RecA/RadA recombinase
MSKIGFYDRFQVAATLPSDTYISTGIFTLDVNTLGGFKENKIHLLFGSKGSAKTTTAYHCAKGALNKYPESKVLLLDLENSFDAHYAESIGIDLNRLIVPASRDVEDAHLENYLADITYTLGGDVTDPDTGKPLHISMIILDSLAAAMTEKEVTDIETVERGGQYRAKASKRLFNYILSYARSTKAVKNPVTFIVITQASEEKMYTGATVYNPTGGLSSQFAATNIVRFKGTPIQGNKALMEIKQLFDIKDIKEHGEAKVITDVDFTLIKQRSGGNMQGNVYIAHIDSPEKGVYQNQLLNSPFIFASAKKLDILKGSSVKGYYFSFDEETKYANQDVVRQELATNKKLQDRVALECLKEERLQAEMSSLPRDKYLWGMFVDENVEQPTL